VNVTITGRVLGTEFGFGGAVMLILEQGNDAGTKTNTVAVRCWRAQTKDRAQQFRRGDVVEVFGLISSRQGGKGGWFTNFEAEGLRIVKGANGESEPSGDEMADGGDIPF
jgi:hypothetical protein